MGLKCKQCGTHFDSAEHCRQHMAERELSASPAGYSLELDKDALIYPCAECGKMRSQNQGGTTFTICDECWDKRLGGE